MSKKREKTRANRKLGGQELGRKNTFGNQDLTPYNAARQMNNKNIVYR